MQIYRRANGDVGVRNELWILPTVGCVNGIARQIQNRFLKETSNAEGTDGVFLFSHTYGCSQLGDDHINTAPCCKHGAPPERGRSAGDWSGL